MPENNELELKFDPSTIEHLGIKMYSQLPQALAELVANAYDADAENVIIKFYDNNQDDKKILVCDDGAGMSFEDAKDKFLVIGRKRRIDDAARTTPKGRKITGRKGLGKLALFGIGNNIQIDTTIAGEEKETSFVLKWNEIIASDKVYKPATTLNDKENVNSHGTTITLSELTRASNFDLLSTSISLSKMFDCIGDGFKVILIKNDEEENKIELSRELRYKDMIPEFSWNVAEDIIPKLESDYEHKGEITGKIVSSPEGKVMRQYLRGITLYVNGRLANVASFFGLGETPHAFSYLSGWIDADFLDESEMDLIATDRQSISWDMPEAQELQKFLKKIVNYVVKAWEDGRREKKKKATKERAGVDVDKWKETLPEELKTKVDTIVKTLEDDVKMETDESNKIIKTLFDMVPEYAPYYWRHLHPTIQEASKKLYQEDRNYYAAFQESMKRYKNAVKDKSGVAEEEDLKIVSNAFGKDKPLETTANFKNRPNGQPFSIQTLDNIEDGQMSLSRGAVQGGRNVVSHEEQTDLKETGLFSEKDCLDLLSLLSHLFKRLDESVKRP
jgi:uncharacterized protein (TIGR02391 family)